MAEHYPDIIIVFVPAGCTGVFQPCNMGLQRPFKLLTSRKFHEDIVAEVLSQIDNKVERIIFDDRLGTMQN